PPQLARRVGLPHMLVLPHGRPQGVLDFDIHTAGRTVGVDRSYCTRGQWSRLPAEALVVRGGLFELWRHHYSRPGKLRPIPADDQQSTNDEIARYFQLARFHGKSDAHRSGVKAWCVWAARTPEPIDWRDRF